MARVVPLVAALVAFPVLSGCSKAAPPPASLVLRGGHVVTVDPAKPEAQAVAITGDAISAVGSDADIAPYVGPSTRVVDLNGRLAIPGFIEGHGHFTGVGRSRMRLNLMKVTSVRGDRGDGRRSGEARPPWRMDPRTWLAPGEMEDAAVAGGARVSHPRGDQRRRARSSRVPDPRERTRVVRQPEGDVARRCDREVHESGGRRDPRGREGSTDRDLHRDGLEPDCTRARGRPGASHCRGDHRGQRTRTRSRHRGSALERGHQLPGCWIVVRDGRSLQGVCRSGQARRAPLGDGARVERASCRRPGEVSD